jgi:hypothetical protein
MLALRPSTAARQTRADRRARRVDERRVRARARCRRDNKNTSSFFCGPHIYTFVLYHSLSTVRFRLTFAHVSVCIWLELRSRLSSGSLAMAGDAPNERGCPPNNVVAGTRPDPGPNRPPWYPAERDWAQDEQCPRCNHVFLFHQDAVGCCNNPTCFSFRIPRSVKYI